MSNIINNEFSKNIYSSNCYIRRKKSDNNYKITVYQNKKSFLFVNCWIENIFNSGGEIYLYLNRTSPNENSVFNGAISIIDGHIVFQNYGFFRNDKNLLIDFFDEDIMYNTILGEIVKWSDVEYD